MSETRISLHHCSIREISDDEYVDGRPVGADFLVAGVRYDVEANDSFDGVFVGYENFTTLVFRR